MTNNETTSEYQRIALSVISEPAHQLRDSIDDEQLGELADSLAAEGQHQPIGLKGPMDDGTWKIIWGHRRFLAARLLGWTAITAKLHAADFDELLAAVSENLQRTDLTPVEEARALTRFLDRGQSLAATARLFRRSPSWVAARLNLLEYPEDLMNAVHQGQLPLSVAAILREIDDDGYRAQLVAEALHTGATAATVEVWRAHYLAERERIVANFYTVKEIAERREAWKITVACEVCHADFTYDQTTTLRACLPCIENIRRAVEARDADLATHEGR